MTKVIHVWDHVVPGPTDLTLDSRHCNSSTMDAFIRRLTDYVTTVRALDRIPVVNLDDKGCFRVSSIPEQL